MYRRIESLQQYVLISQDRRSVEVFTRQHEGRWIFEEYTAQDAVVQLESIGCTVPLVDLYEHVELPPRAIHPPTD